MIDEPRGGEAQQLGPNLTSHQLIDELAKMRALLEEHEVGALGEPVKVTVMALMLLVKDLDSAFVSLHDAASAFEALNARFEEINRRLNLLEDRELARTAA